MRECDALSAALVSLCWVIIDSYPCVTDTYVLHMRTAARTHGWCNIMQVIHELDTVA